MYAIGKQWTTLHKGTVMHPYEFFNDQVIVNDPLGLYGFDPFLVMDDHDNLRRLLLDGLLSDVSHQRSNCSSALSELFKAEQVVSDVVSILDDPNVDRVEAIRLAVHFQLPVVEKLLGLLTDENEELRRWSAWALGWYPSSKTRNALRAMLVSHCQQSLLNESDAELLLVSGIEGLRAQQLFDRTSANAAESLVQIGDDRDLPLLLQSLQEGDPLVRLRLAQALAAHQSKRGGREAIATQAKRESGSMQRAFLELFQHHAEESK